MPEQSLQPQSGVALFGQHRMEATEHASRPLSTIEPTVSILAFSAEDAAASASHWPMSRAFQQLLDKLHQRGRERAIASHALEPQPEDLEHLGHEAEAQVLDFCRAAFDPQNNRPDRWRADNFDLHWKERARADTAIKFAHADVGDAKLKLAALQHGNTMPQWPLVITVAAVILLSILAGMTLHDFLAPAFHDEVVSWTLSLLGGGCFALFLTVGIVATSSLGGNLSQHNKAAGHLMLAGGVGLALSLGALRIAQDRSSSSIIIAAALTGLEICCLLYLKGVGAQLHNAFQSWHSRQTELASAQANLDAQRAKLARWEHEFARIEQQLGEIVLYVEERAQRQGDPAELKAAAVHAIHDGYFAGLAANHHRVFGG